MVPVNSDPVEAVIAAWCSDSNVVARIDAMLAALPDVDAGADRVLLLRLKELLIGADWRSLPHQVIWRRKWLRKKAEAELAAVDEKRAERRRALRELKEQEAARAAEEAAAERARRVQALNSLWDCLRSNYQAADHVFASLGDLITPETYRRERIRFVQEWAAKNLPDGKDGLPCHLDDEQAMAVGSLDKTVKITARAGSGKTQTLAARAAFLMKHCGVPSDEVLLLAFNRKAALSLRERLLMFLIANAKAEVDSQMARRSAAWHRLDEVARQDAAIDVVARESGIALPHVFTFHALARAVVHSELAARNAEAPDLLVDTDADDAQSRVVQTVIDDHLRSREFYDHVRDVMMTHFREDWSRIVSGGYHLGKEEFLKYRELLPLETFAGEHVKSRGEKVIADFLFRHDVPYKYERNHFWSGVNYRPDFTLFITGKTGVIVEFFGLAGDEAYDEMTDDKRRYWSSKQGWQLIEVFPKDLDSGLDAFDQWFRAKLEGAGVACAPLSDDQVWSRVRERAVDRFTRSMRGFVSRCRKQKLSADDLRVSIDHHKAVSAAEDKFIQVAQRIYSGYLTRLEEEGADDFDGLLARAASVIGAGNTLFCTRRAVGDLLRIKWLFVDEFQDFSVLFHGLIVSMRQVNPSLHLFCVGDDWQAINGFAGSDLKFFRQFESHLGSAAELRVATNYRSSEEIVAAGNSLMCRTGGSPARANRGSAGPLLVGDLEIFQPRIAELETFPGDWITPAVLRLCAKFTGEGRSVVLLNRTNFMGSYVSDVQARELNGFLNAIRKKLPPQSAELVSASTAHGYKGLESDVVIVLDCNVRRYPLVHADWVFARVFGDDLDSISAEERRLFYVAVTRAERTLVLLTERRRVSPFLNDIERACRTAPIDWSAFPVTLLNQNGRLTVEVSSQKGRGSSPTASISHLLKASHYRFDSVQKKWWKQVSENDAEKVRDELWVDESDGVEVRFLDSVDRVVGRFTISRESGWEALGE